MMDFNTIDTKADAERGAWLHLRHPQLKHPLYTGEGADQFGRWSEKTKTAQPVRLLLRGGESEHVREKLKRLKSRALSDALGDDDAVAMVLPFVIQVEGVRNGDREIGTSEADLRWLFARSDQFVLQVAQFVADAGNFFSGADRN